MVKSRISALLCSGAPHPSELISILDDDDLRELRREMDKYESGTRVVCFAETAQADCISLTSEEQLDFEQFEQEAQRRVPLHALCVLCCEGHK